MACEPQLVKGFTFLWQRSADTLIVFQDDLYLVMLEIVVDGIPQKENIFHDTSHFDTVDSGSFRVARSQLVNIVGM